MSRKLLATTAALLGLLGAGLAAPALADGNTPPVPVDDDAYVLQGSMRLFDLAANDTDDAPDVALCRVGKAPGIDTIALGGRAGLGAVDFTSSSVSPLGDYAVDYQACDHDYLSIGHATLHVVAPQTPTVSTTSDPGVLTVHNPNPVPMVAAWGDPTAKRADGMMRVGPDADAQFTVTRHKVAWIAVDPWSFAWDGVLGQGVVSGIELPATAARPTTGSVPWRSSAIGPRLRRAVRDGSGASAQSDWPTDPTTVEPPTPVADTITWWAGSSGLVHVVGNDTDPAGQRLTVCRTDGTPYGSQVTLSSMQGRLYVGTGNRFAGARIVHYGVCNDGRVATATLTVVTRAAKPLVVRRGAQHPRRLHVRNPNDTRVLLWTGRLAGGWVYAMPRGFVPAGGERTFRVRSRALFWQGTIGSHSGFAGRGNVAAAH